MKEESNKEWEEQEHLGTEEQAAQAHDQQKEEAPDTDKIQNTASAALALHYAGFWMRFWAYLLDLIVIGSISRLFVYPLFRSLGIDTASGELFSAINMATVAVFYLYFMLMTKKWGQTVGKMVFGLKVISLKSSALSWKTILFREWIGRYISATIPFLYVLVAFLSKKQGLHDYFADTTVIHEHTMIVKTSAHTV
ncbi:RDD family protein [Bacillus sp. B190/17]|uniref:RDD family protein n=1 Tax=Bacillus lumedeiriae TaxID=3058829 RepID=A0ABW8I5G7_9BACI